MLWRIKSKLGLILAVSFAAGMVGACAPEPEPAETVQPTDQPAWTSEEPPAQQPEQNQESPFGGAEPAQPQPQQQQLQQQPQQFQQQPQPAQPMQEGENQQQFDTTPGQTGTEQQY